MDEYTPSLPAMAAYFGSTDAFMQLSLSLYMLTFAFSQILLGPLSDAFGRRPVLIYATPIFFIGNVVCILANHAEVLLLGRVIMGLGVGALAFTASALIVDTFKGKELSQVASNFSTAYSFVPIAAPVVGGILQHQFGWRSNFIFILLVSLLVYLIYFFWAPETKIIKAGERKNILPSYRAVVTSKKFWFSVLSIFAIWTAIISFSVMAPFLYQKKYGFSPWEYGFLAMFVGFGVLLGNATNSRALKKHKPEAIVNFALRMWLVVGVLFLGITFLEPHAWVTTAFVFLTTYAGGIAFPNLYAIGASSVPEYNGTANAMMGGFMLFGATAVTAFETMLDAASSFDLAAVYLALACICFLFSRGLRGDFVS